MATQKERKKEKHKTNKQICQSKNERIAAHQVIQYKQSLAIQKSLKEITDWIMIFRSFSTLFVLHLEMKVKGKKYHMLKKKHERQKILKWNQMNAVMSHG